MQLNNFGEIPWRNSRVGTTPHLSYASSGEDGTDGDRPVTRTAGRTRCDRLGRVVDTVGGGAFELHDFSFIVLVEINLVQTEPNCPPPRPPGTATVGRDCPSGRTDAPDRPVATGRARPGGFVRRSRRATRRRRSRTGRTGSRYSRCRELPVPPRHYRRRRAFRTACYFLPEHSGRYSPTLRVREPATDDRSPVRWFGARRSYRLRVADEVAELVRPAAGGAWRDGFGRLVDTVGIVHVELHATTTTGPFHIIIIISCRKIPVPATLGGRRRGRDVPGAAGLAEPGRRGAEGVAARHRVDRPGYDRRDASRLRRFSRRPERERADAAHVDRSGRPATGSLVAVRVAFRVEEATGRSWGNGFGSVVGAAVDGLHFEAHHRIKSSPRY